jgi:hypothetical protein
MIARRWSRLPLSPLVSALALAASVAAAGCSDNAGNKAADAGVPDASKEPIVGGKLGAVIASAEAASSAAPGAKGKAAGSDGDAPPESGIFAAGDADKKVPAGAPPKIDLISDGVGNKVQLVTKLDAPEQKATISVSMRMGQSRTPSIEFALSIKPEKAKGDKPKDAPADAVAHLAATVTGANLPSTQGMSKEMVDAINKLKGTVVRYDLTAAGAASNFTTEVPKGAGEGLELVLATLVDAISTMTVPLPAKPVGKDAYWIVADRAKAAAGLDVVRYRVFKILKNDADGVTFSLDIRQYAAEAKLKLDAPNGQKQEMSLDAFDSQGKGTIVWKTDAYLPVKADMKEGLAARLAIPGQPQGGRGAPVVQTELSAAINGGTGGAADKP